MPLLQRSEVATIDAIADAPAVASVNPPGCPPPTDEPALPAPAKTLTAQRWQMAHATGQHDVAARQLLATTGAARCEDVAEVVAEEVPVALVYNGISHAVMLASPDNLEDFACGFSLSEAIVDAVAEIYDIDVVAHPGGIELRIDLASAAMQRLKTTRRMRTGKTGCGLCGIESLAQFDNDVHSAICSGAGAGEGADIVQATGVLTGAALHRAMAGLSQGQTLHAATGATHAAGWADWNGATLLTREDVGRHNALDKLIGALARQRIDTAGGIAVVTSRASFEMVQKAARAGISVLAAVSAPTAMAVRLADAAGLTLAGFVRAGRHVVYTHPHRCRN